MRGLRAAGRPEFTVEIRISCISDVEIGTTWGQKAPTRACLSGLTLFVLESSPVAVANPAKRPDVAANGGYSRGSRD